MSARGRRSGAGPRTKGASGPPSSSKYFANESLPRTESLNQQESATVSALFRRFRFVAAIGVGLLAAIAADAWLGLGRGAALAAIVSVAVVYMIIEWRYDGRPERRRPRRSRTPYRSPFAVSFDDEEIIVTLDGARRESVK